MFSEWDMHLLLAYCDHGSLSKVIRDQNRPFVWRHRVAYAGTCTQKTSIRNLSTLRNSICMDRREQGDLGEATLTFAYYLIKWRSCKISELSPKTYQRVKKRLFDNKGGMHILDTFFHLFDKIVCLMKGVKAFPLHSLAHDNRLFPLMLSFQSNLTLT